MNLVYFVEVQPNIRHNSRYLNLRLIKFLPLLSNSCVFIKYKMKHFYLTLFYTGADYTVYLELRDVNNSHRKTISD